MLLPLPAPPTIASSIRERQEAVETDHLPRPTLVAVQLEPRLHALGPGLAAQRFLQFAPGRRFEAAQRQRDKHLGELAHRGRSGRRRAFQPEQPRPVVGIPHPAQVFAQDALNLGILNRALPGGAWYTWITSPRTFPEMTRLWLPRNTAPEPMFSTVPACPPSTAAKLALERLDPARAGLPCHPVSSSLHILARLPLLS